MNDIAETLSNRTRTCQLLKDIEERLSECTLDDDDRAAIHQFIKDCFANVTDDNILTETEVEQWKILKANNAIEISSEDDPMFSCNDIEVLEKELRLMEKERDEISLTGYDELEGCLNVELTGINASLSELEQAKLESKKLLEEALNKYEEDSENAFNTNCQVIEDLKNFHRRIMMDQYLCEAPLTALKEKFDCFLETFETHLRNHFLETTKRNKWEKHREVVAEVNQLEKCLSSSYFENYILKSMLKGQEAALSHVNAMTDAIKNGAEIPTETKIENELAEFRNSKTTDDIIAEFKNDLLSLSQMNANVEVLKHIVTMCNSKYNRVNYWVSQMKKWANCVKSEKKLVNGILCVLHSEEEQVSKIWSIIKDFEGCLKRAHEGVVCRTALMQTQLQIPVENSMLCSVLANILVQFTTAKDMSTTLSLRQLEEPIINIRKSIVCKQNKFFQLFTDSRKILFENCYWFKLISNLKRDSGVNHSEITIDKYSQSLRDCEKALCAVKQDFTEKQNTISTNYFVKHKRLLWVYILCDEQKLEEVLSYANKHLSEISM